MRASQAVVALSIVLATPLARADGEDAVAQALFEEGKAKMAAGDYDVGCAKLEESNHLQAGGGTMMYLALCREAQGKTASAWAAFNTTLSMARRDKRADREKIATEHLAALTPKLTKLTIEVAPEATALATIEVALNGKPIDRATWGSALPVDPGEQLVTATAPGKKRWEDRTTVNQAGTTTTIRVPALVDDPTAAPAIVPMVTPLAAPLPATTVDARRGDGQRTAGIVVAAIGVAGVGVGAVFGGLALAKKSDEKAYCPGGASGGCQSQGVSLSKTAVTFGDVSTVGIGVGAAALVAGAVLFFTAPKHAKESARRWLAPELAPHRLGLAGGVAF